MAFTALRIPRKKWDPPPEAPAPVEGKALTLGDGLSAPPLFYSPTLFWKDTGDPIDAAKLLRGVRAYMAAPIAFACITFRALKFREPPLMVVEETADGDKWLPGHRQAGILARPNPDWGMRRMMEATSILLDTTGACLWVKNRGVSGGVIASMYPFGQDEFRVESAWSERAQTVRLYGRFFVDTATGERTKAPEDVVHFFNYNPADPWKGLAPLDVALRFLGIGGQLAETLRASLRNFALPGGLYSVDGHLSDEEYARLLAQVRTQYRDARSGAPMLLEGGAKWNSTQSPLKDLALGEIYREVEATVCQCFQVPPVMVGAIIGIENSPWSNIEQATRNWYDNGCEPRWQDAEEVLTEGVLRTEGDRDPSHLVRFDRSRVKGLAEDREKKARESRLARGWTLDECRIHTGQEPLPSDDPRGNMIPDVDILKSSAPAAQGKGRFPPFSPEDPGRMGPEGFGADPLLTGGNRPDYVSAPTSGKGRWHPAYAVSGPETSFVVSPPPVGAWGEVKRPSAMVGGVACVYVDGVWRPLGEVKAAEARAAYFGIVDAVEATHAGGIANACEKLFKADRREVLRIARKTVKAGGKAEDGDVPVDGDTADDAAAAVREYLVGRVDEYASALGGLLERGSADAVSRLGDVLGVGYDVLQPGVLAFAEEERGWLARTLTETTADAVVRELKAARANGLTPSALFDRLEDLPEFDRARAELVGRTETTRITNGAGRRAMEQFQTDGGGKVTKHWLTAGDARVRASHQKLNGEARPVEQAFSNGLQHPGEPNCRCTLTYTIEAHP